MKTKIGNIVKILSLFFALAVVLIYFFSPELSGNLGALKSENYRTCGAGVPSLSELSKHSSKISSYNTTSEETVINTLKLKKDLDFWGLTYSSDSDPKDLFKSSVCKEPNDRVTDIVLVNSEINQIVKLYISTVFSNETEFYKAQNLLDSTININEIWLYQDIRGGYEKPDIDPVNFKIETKDELNSARYFADRLLAVNCLNQLRKIKTNAAGPIKEPRKLTDEEIFDIILSARKIALTEAQPLSDK